MCTINKKVYIDTEPFRDRIGWKIFKIYDGIMKPPIYNSHNINFKLYEWVKSPSGPGFHVFETKELAQKAFDSAEFFYTLPYCFIRKVKYRNILTIGDFYNEKCNEAWEAIMVPTLIVEEICPLGE